ncbi:MAG: hypothetical protein AB1Z66_09840 [Candidatus Limnocylindrales bacterium]
MPSIPNELLYVLAAFVVGYLLYRYFTGHGGIEIRRGDYAGLPDEGQLEVRSHVVRWKVAEGDSFVAAWQLGSGHYLVMRVVFDDVDEEDPDLGYIDVDIDRREAVSGASWTDRIRDRALRADVEGILRMLQREAKAARSDKARLASARKVGDDRSGPELE